MESHPMVSYEKKHPTKSNEILWNPMEPMEFTNQVPSNPLKNLVIKAHRIHPIKPNIKTQWGPKQAKNETKQLSWGSSIPIISFMPTWNMWSKLMVQMLTHAILGWWGLGVGLCTQILRKLIHMSCHK